MNLQALRQTLLDQVQESWKENARLRYRVFEDGVERTVHLPGRETAEPGLWWNLCLHTQQADAGAGERSFSVWEILEIVVSPPLGLRAVERVREIFKTKWNLERQGVEWLVGQQEGPDGAYSPQLCARAPRLPEKRSAGEVAKLPVAAWQDAESDVFRIQWNPHQLFHLTGNVPSAFDLSPYRELLERLTSADGTLDRARETLELLRFWAHALNERELADDEEGTPYEAELSERAAAALASLGPDEPDVDRWLDDVRALEDALFRNLVVVDGEELGEEAAGEEESLAAAPVGMDEDEAAPMADGNGTDPRLQAESSVDIEDEEGEDGILDSRHEGPVDRVDVYVGTNDAAGSSEAEAPTDGSEPAYEIPRPPQVVDSEQAAAGPPTNGAPHTNGNGAVADLEVAEAIDPVTSAYTERDLPRKLRLDGVAPTLFAGRDQDACEGRILGLFDLEGKRIELAEKGREAWIVASRTCCAGFGDGLVSDQGWIYNSVGAAEVQAVRRTDEHLVHLVRVTRGRFRVGEEVDVLVDERRRRDLERHATAAQAVWATWQAGRGGWELVGHEVTPEGFSLTLRHAEALEVREDWVHGVEDRLAQWVLEADWIDVLEHPGLGTTCFGPRGRYEPGPDRTPLSFGALGQIDGGWIACRQSSELGLVRLQVEPTEDAWRLKGLAGRAAAAAFLHSARTIAARRGEDTSGAAVEGGPESSGDLAAVNGSRTVASGL